MDKMELKALGKINLGLDVLGRRENGYHDVRMVMQTVYLYDQIRMEKTKKPGIELLTNLFYLPVNENNLAYQAADLLMKEFHVKEGVKITLDKHIPVAAGMFERGSRTVRDQPYVFAWTFTERTDGKRRDTGSRCSLLCYARNRSCRRDRRDPHTTSGMSEMPCADRKTADQCVDKTGL